MDSQIDLITAAGVLELARVEPRATAEEVVDLPGLHVVGESGDEQRVDQPLLAAGEARAVVRHRRRDRQVVGIVGLVRHYTGDEIARPRNTVGGGGGGGGEERVARFR